MLRPVMPPASWQNFLGEVIIIVIGFVLVLARIPPALQDFYNAHCNVFLCSVWSSKQPVSKLFNPDPECYCSLRRSAAI